MFWQALPPNKLTNFKKIHPISLVMLKSTARRFVIIVSSFFFFFPTETNSISLSNQILHLCRDKFLVAIFFLPNTESFFFFCALFFSFLIKCACTLLVTHKQYNTSLTDLELHERQKYKPHDGSKIRPAIKGLC